MVLVQLAFTSLGLFGIPLIVMPLTLERVRTLTVLELRKELKQRGEESKGNKAVLVERLTKLVSAELAEAEAKAPKKRPGRSSKKKSATAAESDKEGATATASGSPSDTPAHEQKEKDIALEADADAETAAATANGKASADAEAGGDAEAKSEAMGTEDDNPLSDERMKRRAERFGIQWPRKGTNGGAKRAKMDKKAAAIAPFTLTADEIKKREERKNRFAVPPGDAVEGAK